MIALILGWFLFLFSWIAELSISDQKESKLASVAIKSVGFGLLCGYYLTKYSF